MKERQTMKKKKTVTLKNVGKCPERGKKTIARNRKCQSCNFKVSRETLTEKVNFKQEIGITKYFLYPTYIIS